MHVSISIHWKFPNLLFSPVISCLFDSLAGQLPVVARIPCFLVSEQNCLKFSRESLFLLPLPTQKLPPPPLPPPLFMFLSAYFSWTLMFFFCRCPLFCVLKSFCYLIQLHLIIGTFSFLLSVLKAQLLQLASLCRSSLLHKLRLHFVLRLWQHFSTLFNYLACVFYARANQMN